MFSERIECSQPIKVECHRLGVCRVDADGRACSTVFERLQYDGTNSIVACQCDSNSLAVITMCC